MTGTITQQGTLQVFITAAHSVTVTVRFSVTISGTQMVLVTYCGPHGAAAAAAGAQQSLPTATALAAAANATATTKANPDSFILAPPSG